MLRRLMAQAGLNANQLADRLKVSPQLVRDWEQGRKKNASLDTRAGTVPLGAGRYFKEAQIKWAGPV